MADYYSQAQPGKLIQIQYSTDGIPPDTPATVWVMITETYDIPELPIVRDRWNVTTHGPGVFSDQILGLVPPIDIVVSCNYVKPQYDVFYDLAYPADDATPAAKWFRILWPDGEYHMFAALVAGVTPATPLNEHGTYQATLATKGAITRVLT